MAARLTRAKKKIAAARIPYAVPGPRDLPERVDAVLTVIHLLYATGHTAPSGEELVRDDLTARALDLARMLRLLLPRRPRGGRAAGAAARPPRPARDAHRRARAPAAPGGAGPRGMGPRADRRGRPADRRRAARRPARALHAAGGDRGAARRGAGLRRRPTGRRSSSLYDELLRVWPSPVVALNRAVALAMVDGPAAALAEVEALERDGRLAGYRYLPATKADLLHRLGPRRRGRGGLPRRARAHRQRGRAGVPRRPPEPGRARHPGRLTWLWTIV